jgi:O-acetyl-ADP-ribose deacetylase (regulator of RNase III)
VNAANTALAPGGGVCGAILRAGGASIFDEAASIGGCPTGGAVATNAGALPARYVIHAVGPMWHGGGDGEEALLASAYRSALEVAVGLGCHTVALPAISTGIYGFPAERAAPIAVGAAQEFTERLREIRFVFLDEAARAPYAAAS